MADSPPLPVATRSPLVRSCAWLAPAAFAVGALLVWFVRPDVRAVVATAFAAYAAVALAMIGGVDWALGLRDDDARACGWGVLFVLLAWLGVLMPPRAGLVLLGASLGASYIVDRRLYAAHRLGHWRTPRFRLSALGAFGCFVGAAGA